MDTIKNKATKKTIATAIPDVDLKDECKDNSVTSGSVKKSTKPIIKKRVELDPNSIITVKNGFQGSLVYKSKKTGERFVWSSFGDEQDMELSELKSAKNSYKSFYINNWFMIEDPDVIDYLGVSQYYDNALSFEEFESLFAKTPQEIEDKLSKLSAGQKHSIAFRAKQLISEGEIDSNKVISTLEKCLSIDLIDR